MIEKFNQRIADRMLQQIRKVFIEKIENCAVDEIKVVAIIGGQPGAGKSSITQQVSTKFDDNIVVLNGDDFKSYFPNYYDLLATDPDNTSNIVQPYSNYVVNQLKQELVDKQLNVMVEGTMRNAQIPLNTAIEFNQNGYISEAFVVAVNYFSSRVSCLERYEQDLIINGAGRSVAKESHDEAYNKIPSTLQALLNSSELSNITIYNRSGNILAESSKHDNMLDIYTLYRENITPEICQDIAAHIDVTRTLMNQRNATADEYIELDSIALSLELNQCRASCEQVIDFFQKLSPDITKKVLLDGYIEVSGVNGGIAQLSDNQPEHLAALLGTVTSYELPHFMIKSNTEHYQYNILQNS